MLTYISNNSWYIENDLYIYISSFSLYLSHLNTPNIVYKKGTMDN